MCHDNVKILFLHRLYPKLFLNGHFKIQHLTSRLNFLFTFICCDMFLFLFIIFLFCWIILRLWHLVLGIVTIWPWRIKSCGFEGVYHVPIHANIPKQKLINSSSLCILKSKEKSQKKKSTFSIFHSFYPTNNY